MNFALYIQFNFISNIFQYIAYNFCLTFELRRWNGNVDYQKPRLEWYREALDALKTNDVSNNIGEISYYVALYRDNSVYILICITL